jgi:hypothetical protein
MHKIVHFWSAIVIPRYQIAILLVTAFLTCVIGYYGQANFRDLEPMPQLIAITPNKLQELGSGATPVKVGLHVSDWVEFDVSRNSFVFDGVVWFEFDPVLVSLDVISKFSFNKGTIVQRDEPKTKLVGKNLFVLYKVRVRLTFDFTYQLFPFDNHAMHIELINKYVSPGELIFVALRSGFIMSEGAYSFGWQEASHFVNTGYEEGYLDENDTSRVLRNPKAVFSIIIHRSGIRYILLVILPLFLIFFIGLLSFGFTDARTISSLAPASVASIIGYRFVMQNLSPNVGYFMLADHIFMLFLIFACIVLAVGILVIYHLLTDKPGESISPYFFMVRGLLFLSFHLGFLSVWYYLLFIWGS